MLIFSTYSFTDDLLRLLFGVRLHPQRIYVFNALSARWGTKSKSDYQADFCYPWKVSIGDAVWISRGCDLYVSVLAGNAKIAIGDTLCALAPRVGIESHP